jgi:Fur family transcriptional regulator, ferric uptake regulator
MQRRTRQRAAILDVMRHAERPLSPEEVLDAARQRVPSLGIATVYRALKQLVTDGVVLAVELPGQSTRFEWADRKHHAYFHCRACGRVFELEGCFVDHTLALPDDMTQESHKVVFTGVCRGCGENASNAPSAVEAAPAAGNATI